MWVIETLPNFQVIFLDFTQQAIFVHMLKNATNFGTSGRKSVIVGLVLSNVLEKTVITAYIAELKMRLPKPSFSM